MSPRGRPVGSGDGGALRGAVHSVCPRPFRWLPSGSGVQGLSAEREEAACSDQGQSPQDARAFPSRGQVGEAGHWRRLRPPRLLSGGRTSGGSHGRNRDPCPVVQQGKGARTRGEQNPLRLATGRGPGLRDAGDEGGSGLALQRGLPAIHRLTAPKSQAGLPLKMLPAS